MFSVVTALVQPEIDVIDAIIRSRTSSSSKVGAITNEVAKVYVLVQQLVK